jgi:hypothetical protein
MNELVALAAAIEAGNAPLPPFIGKLIQNAPDSFQNERAAKLAVIVREKRAAGEPVLFEVLAEENFPLLNFIKCELEVSSIGMAAAEYYAAEYWNAFQIRRTQNVLAQAHENVIAHPEQTKAIIAGVRNALDAVAGESQTDDLPELIDAADFLATPVEMPVELVEGIIDKGCKFALGGASKAKKTWTLLDLAISVASGADWLGRKTKRGKVLFLNFEIRTPHWHLRLEKVARAKGVVVEPGQIVLWNLRGYAGDFRILIPKIIARAREKGFDLIIVDPIYKIYCTGADENSTGDMAELMNGLERIAVQTGAAIGYGSHFSKGNQSEKNAIDRISGSGVYGRDPDALLIFTEHNEPNAYTVDPILRDFAPVESFVVRWQFPLMQPADELDPSKLKKTAGRNRAYDPKKILTAIADTTREQPISVSAWAAAGNVPRQTLTDYLPEMRRQKWIETTGEGNTARQFITNEGRAFINES